jgi:uncharacterized protein (DUF362 family)
MAKVVLTSVKEKNFSNKDVHDAVSRALDQLNFNFNYEIRTVVIKPNMCYYWDHSTGQTTDPRVVSAVIDFVRDHVSKDMSIIVAEADASAMKTHYSFRVLGYDKMCEAKSVGLVNLSEGDITDTPVRVGKKEFTLPVNNALLKADLVINVPKLKTHNVVGATCALKNMFGAISKPRKYSYHGMLADAIVGMNKIVKSHIVVVDGIVALGAYPKKLGIILAGDDALATDFKATEIMGFNPMKVAHLNSALREHVGQTNNIKLVEDNVKLSEVKKNFPRYSYSMHRISWSLQLKMLRMYGAIAGDVIPPVLEG